MHKTGHYSFSHTAMQISHKLTASHVVCSELKCQFFIGPTKEPKRPRGVRVEMRSQPRNSDGAKLSRRDSLVLTTYHQYVPYERLSSLLRPNGLSMCPRGPDMKRGHSLLGCPLARARPQSVGRRGYVQLWRTDDDVRFAMTVREIAPQRFSRRAGSWPRRPSLHAYLMARQFWRTHDKAWRGSAPAA